jgi:D-methionine transport system permease protein
MSFDPLLRASFETIFMVFLSGFLAALAGIPLGVALFLWGRKKSHRLLYHTLAFIINAFRSVPFIILLVFVIPLTRILVGTSIGTSAALVPLTLAAIPFLARLVEAALMEIPSGLLEASTAMGATARQLVQFVLLPEALGGITNAVTVTLVNLIGFSAMAGAIGGGGLGDLAIRFGYQRFDVSVMIATICVLIVMVQAIQLVGEIIGKWVRKG